MESKVSASSTDQAKCSQEGSFFGDAFWTLLAYFYRDKVRDRVPHPNFVDPCKG
jgi:hypothetical protein